jgi:GNAT superfamily N-acetyltransferase
LLTLPPILPDFESYLAQFEVIYWAIFSLDWSQDASKIVILNNRYAAYAQSSGEDIFPDAWLLENLTTHADYQRRGIGARLIKWGLDQAEAERVPVSVESSFAGVSLYEKMGFRKFDEMRYGEKEIETMPVMVWEPACLEGRWFDRAKAAVDERRRVQ